MSDNKSNAPTNNSVSIVLNHASGGLSLASTLTVGNAPVGIAPDDFFGTHRLGLAVVNVGSTNVQVLAQSP